MKNLTQEKERIVKDHMDNIVTTNNKVLDMMNKAIKDKKISAGGEIGGLLDSIKALANISYGSTSEMKSEDRLELAKLYFQNADNIRKTISEDSGYNSLLKNIDDQFAIVKEEMKQIDERLKEVNDEDEREGLIKEKEAGWATAEPPLRE
jgi:hypothetical protein